MGPQGAEVLSLVCTAVTDLHTMASALQVGPDACSKACMQQLHIALVAANTAYHWPNTNGLDGPCNSMVAVQVVLCLQDSIKLHVETTNRSPKHSYDKLACTAG
jgi:hypothetical protein